MMGKNKHKNEKYKHHSGEYVEGSPAGMSIPGVPGAGMSIPGVPGAGMSIPGVPKLIVKFGSDLTPERVESPGEVLSYPLQTEQDQYQYHHRHKEKKKKKKKDKKKRDDKERSGDHRTDREHRHHHKKKKKREYDSGESGERLAPNLGGAAHLQLPPTQMSSVPGSQYYHNVTQQTPTSAAAALQPSLSDGGANPPPAKIPKLDIASDSDASVGGSLSGLSGGMVSPKMENAADRSSASTTQRQKSTLLTKVLEYLIAMLERKDVTHFFSQPVSDTFAPGYSQIIKEPMDFSTMNDKIEENKYENLNQFRRDFELICKNCMMYNTPETVYHKAAQRLLLQGKRILSPDRLRALADNHIPILQELTPDLLGFDIKTETPEMMSFEDERDCAKIIAEIRGSVRRPANRFEAIPDNMTPEEIASQVANAAKNASNRLKRRRPGGQMGYLCQKPDGTTSLAIVAPASVVVEGGDKTVTLGQLIGRVKNGASALQGFKEDRRNCVKAFNPIYYGAFSSYGPAYDSTFANLTKQETELVYNTYGDDVGVAYAESIKNFSKNCEYATIIVDNLLDILTGNEHKKTSKYIEEQKLLRSEESLVKSAFNQASSNGSSNGASPQGGSSVDFDSLRSLAKDGIDMSFLESLQTQYTRLPTTRLDKNAVLLESLRDVQHQRLSGPPPQHLGQVTGPSNDECAISERVQQNLVSLVAETARPTDVFIQGGRS